MFDANSSNAGRQVPKHGTERAAHNLHHQQMGSGSVQHSHLFKPAAIQQNAADKFATTGKASSSSISQYNSQQYKGHLTMTAGNSAAMTSKVRTPGGTGNARSGLARAPSHTIINPALRDQ